MSETITAGHLNATHLGKRITINGKYGTVVSGKLKKIRADYAIMPDFASYSSYKEDIPKQLWYRKLTDITSGDGTRTYPVLLSHFQWREDFTQSKPLGAVSTNWNAPKLAEYAIPYVNNTLLLHGHTHAYDPLEFGRHHNEINVGLDAWCFEPVNEAELVDNWLHTALSVAE